MRYFGRHGVRRRRNSRPGILTHALGPFRTKSVRGGRSKRRAQASRGSAVAIQGLIECAGSGRLDLPIRNGGFEDANLSALTVSNGSAAPVRDYRCSRSAANSSRFSLGGFAGDSLHLQIYSSDGPPTGLANAFATALKNQSGRTRRPRPRPKGCRPLGAQLASTPKQRRRLRPPP
jgi:hypothetical protein